MLLSLQILVRVTGALSLSSPQWFQWFQIHEPAVWNGGWTRWAWTCLGFPEVRSERGNGEGKTSPFNFDMGLVLAWVWVKGPLPFPFLLLPSRSLLQQIPIKPAGLEGLTQTLLGSAVMSVKLKVAGSFRKREKNPKNSDTSRYQAIISHNPVS